MQVTGSWSILEKGECWGCFGGAEAGATLMPARSLPGLWTQMQMQMQMQMRCASEDL
jgi:hypothetical protein